MIQETLAKPHRQAHLATHTQIYWVYFVQNLKKVRMFMPRNKVDITATSQKYNTFVFRMDFLKKIFIN